MIPAPNSNNNNTKSHTDDDDISESSSFGECCNNSTTDDHNNNNNSNDLESIIRSTYGGDDHDDHISHDGTSTCDEMDERFHNDIEFIALMKLFVILTILTFAFVSSDVVFLVTSNHELENFQIAYSDLSNQLINTMKERMNSMIYTDMTFVYNIEQETKNKVWPYVTISNFHKRCIGPLQLTHGSIMTLAPYVSKSNLTEWEYYNSFTNQDVYNIADSNNNNNNNNNIQQYDNNNVVYYNTNRSIQEGVYKFTNGTVQDVVVENDSIKHFFPITHMSSIPYTSSDMIQQQPNTTSNVVGILYDETSNIIRSMAIEQMMNRTGCVVSGFLYNDTNRTDMAFYQTPRTNLYYPIIQQQQQKQQNSSFLSSSSSSSSDDGNIVVGMINLQFQWDVMFQNVIIDDEYSDYNTDDVGNLVIVVQNQCYNQQYTYSVHGTNVSFIGAGDLHDKKVKDYPFAYNTTYNEFIQLFDDHGKIPWDNNTACAYRITIYPSKEFKQSFLTKRPNIYMFIVIFALFFILCIFLGFDRTASSTQNNVMDAAKVSDEIVRSLFPGHMADKLYEKTKAKKKARDNLKNNNNRINERGNMLVTTRKSLLKNYMQSNDDAISSDEPLADVYPSASVIFADIAGFTSWSSERDPTQVFILLETIYKRMDLVTKKFSVFKVETIGDCYVAATGLPVPRDDHAVQMCRFARVCLTRTNRQFQQLVTLLGPGTSDLGLRIGIHSGSVTAGVLRGQKCRFQLFGDTMNTASRMESTGVKGRIHISEKTAELLTSDGKSNWITAREDVVEAKGKGKMQTYWLASISTSGSRMSIGSSSVGSSSEMSSEISTDFGTVTLNLEGTGLESVFDQTRLISNVSHLIGWNTDILLDLLLSVTRQRAANRVTGPKISPSVERQILSGNGSIPSQEVKMLIPNPKFDSDVEERARKMDVDVSSDAANELRSFVAMVAAGYQRNPFHNFEHASHVVLAATKLLKRIMSADDHKSADGDLTTQDLHKHTFGIACDPMSHFAIVFSCLCHDLDHAGVPNLRLETESPHLASKYDSQSVAEQHSIDIAFKLLMLPEFANLRQAIYVTEDECRRFRQLCVNLIMATDVMDPNLKKMRNERWDMAFQNSEKDSACEEDRFRRATIVLEHCIQASDVNHTMQHWHVYIKWNERLFQEMYFAYLNGRSEKDPSEFWYKGEIGFFDFYIIPLANKLKDCWSVFGISHGEFLSYALSNRDEWESKGMELVQQMKDRAFRKYHTMMIKCIEEFDHEDDVSLSDHGVSDVDGHLDLYTSNH